MHHLPTFQRVSRRREEMKLQDSMVKRVVHSAYSSSGFGQMMICSELLQQISPTPKVEKLRKQSSELKFRVNHGVLERIDEEGLDVDDGRSNKRNSNAARARHSISYDFDSIQTIKRESLRVRRSRLEEDILKLHKRLEDEMNLREALENALTGCAQQQQQEQHLPDKTRKLLSDIARLEVKVQKLEQQLEESRCLLLQEYERCRGAEHGCVSVSPSSPSRGAPASSSSDPDGNVATSQGIDRQQSGEDDHGSNLGRTQQQCEQPPIPRKHHRKRMRQKVQEEDGGAQREATSNCASDAEMQQQQQQIAAPVSHPVAATLCPVEVSQRMVECMIELYTRIAAVSSPASSDAPYTLSPASPFAHPPSSTSSLSSSSDYLSPSHNARNTEGLCDSAAAQHTSPHFDDPSVYLSATKVRRIVVAKEHLDFLGEMLAKYKLLVEKLSGADVGALTQSQKLAFWINVYNALMMHSYLAYGVPKGEQAVFSLMRKASYCIGQSMVTALSIEYEMLKHKLPMHRPQMALLVALHSKTKPPAQAEEQRRMAIEVPQPLTIFALGCGARSSPLVRVYTAGSVHEQLNQALRDYARAWVGLTSGGKLYVPRLLYAYAREAMMDVKPSVRMLDWLLVHLPSCERSLLKPVPLCLAVPPFDPSFQFLILPPTTTALNLSR